MKSIIMKQTIIISFVIFLISIGISILFYKSFSLLSMINSLFSVGMSLFLISAFLFIGKSGFFDGIIYSFRQFYKSYSKQGQQIGDELDHMALPSEYSYSFIKPMFYSSFLTIGLMLILLFFYY